MNARHGPGGGIAREERRSRPRAADPLDAAELFSIEIHPRKTISALAHIAAEIDGGFPIRAMRCRNEERGLRRSMVRQPRAGLVLGVPRGLSGSVDRELIAHVDVLMPNAMHFVIAGRDGRAWHVVEA